MSLKTRYLVLGSIITLLAISAIQAYLIYNTYELKKKTFAIEARNVIAQVYSTPEIDSLLWIYRNDFLMHIEKYENHSIDRETTLRNLEQKASQVNKEFLKVYHENLKKSNVGFDIKIKIEADDIIINDSLKKPDVLLKTTTNTPIFLLGENFKNDDGILINNSSWQKDLDNVAGNKQLVLNTKIYMSLLNWEKIILMEMTGLLLISMFLFSFVIALLSYSILNLIKQKRLAEIKTDFINNITHELKTPLTTLAITTKTITNRYAEGHKEINIETVEVIERQNKRLQNLIDQVVNNSIGYTEIELSREEFYAPLFITNLINDFKISLNKEVTITFNFQETFEKIVADKFYLGTAILNLLSNAVKYGGTEITVKYKFNEKKSSHIITVIDNGIGIPKKHHNLIFEKFYRVSEKDTHNYKGLGLGLYFSTQIIKAHGGTINVVAKEKEGSTFQIHIQKQSL